MQSDLQLTPTRLRAMTKEQIITAYTELDVKLRRKERAFLDVVSERNRLSQQVALLTARTPTVNGEDCYDP